MTSTANLSLGYNCAVFKQWAGIESCLRFFYFSFSFELIERAAEGFEYLTE